MSRTLPLFPLDMVLFPGAVASLQIFEVRYREMLRDAMSDDRRFGVVLLKSGRDTGQVVRTHSVGTVARITEIGSPRRGAIPINIVGETRFHILRESRIHSYLSAEVDLIEDDRAATTSDEIVLASHDATQRYMGTVLASQGVFRTEHEIPADPFKLSYFMGIIATTADKASLQKVLEQEGLGDRMQACVALLEEEADRLQRAFMRTGPGKSRSLFSTN